MSTYGEIQSDEERGDLNTGEEEVKILRKTGIIDRKN